MKSIVLYRLENQCLEMIHFYYGLNMLSSCVFVVKLNN